MADIRVRSVSQDGDVSIFAVDIVEGDTRTEHAVALREADHRRLTGGRLSPPELIKKSFEFLLEREDKESILRRFELTDISKYFPEFDSVIGRL